MSCCNLSLVGRDLMLLLKRDKVYAVVNLFVLLDEVEACAYLTVSSAWFHAYPCKTVYLYGQKGTAITAKQ
jgi:hypothetical protein